MVVQFVGISCGWKKGAEYLLARARWQERSCRRHAQRAFQKKANADPDCPGSALH
jgi:hypothetical protein